MRARNLVTIALLLIFAAGLPAWAAPLGAADARQTRALSLLNRLEDEGAASALSRSFLRGEREMSRYEVALLLADAAQVVEETSLEYAELIAVMHDYIKELKELGVRIGKLEKRSVLLDGRVEKLERVSFYADIHTLFISQTVGGNALAGTMAGNNIDWVTGRPLVKGVGFSGNIVTGARLKVNERLKADVQFASYYSQGEPFVDAYWGITPPFLANPFTAFGGNASGTQSTNHAPYTRTVLDRVSLDFTKSSLLLDMGAFNPELVPQGLVMGMRNPSVCAPAVLPFYGFNFHRRAEKRNNFETFYARLPQINYVDFGGTSWAYYTWLGGAAYSIPMKNGKLTLGAARMINESDRNGAGQLPGVSFQLLPTQPWNVRWLDERAGGTIRSSVGPQEENLYGFNFLHTVNGNLSVELEVGLSSYRPDRSATTFDTAVQGSLARLTLNYKKASFDGRLDLFSVGSTYDPFVLQYPQNTNTPTFLPFGAYYTNYWQMHDYLSWPDNRTGGRLTGNVNFTEKTRLHYHLASYGQVDPTTPAEPTALAVKAGMVEPLFPILKEGGSQKGDVLEAGFSLAHQFESRLQGSLSYYHFLTRRDAPGRDYINNHEDYYSLDLSYPVTDWLRATAGYTFIDYSGRTGALSNNFTQTVPYLGFNVQVTANTAVSATWRTFRYRDTLTDGRDWSADQVITEYRCKF